MTGTSRPCKVIQWATGSGVRLDRLRPTVREHFVGASTCTRLDDQLRALADVGAPIRPLGDAIGARR